MVSEQGVQEIGSIVLKIPQVDLCFFNMKRGDVSMVESSADLQILDREGLFFEPWDLSAHVHVHMTEWPRVKSNLPAALRRVKLLIFAFTLNQKDPRGYLHGKGGA